jgi:hypothetical protein
LVGVVMAEIAKGSRISERTRVLAIAFGTRQLGLIFGPAYNLLLSGTDFYIGPLHVTQANIPGLLMAIVWIVYEFVFLVVYFNAGHELQQVGVDIYNKRSSSKCILYSFAFPDHRSRKN